MVIGMSVFLIKFNIFMTIWRNPTLMLLNTHVYTIQTYENIICINCIAAGCNIIKSAIEKHQMAGENERA